MNKVVKKIAAVALSGLLVASVFAGCSGGSAKDTYTVGICQSMQHPALDKATEGFKKALTDKLGDKVTFKEQNAPAIPPCAPPLLTSMCLRMWI